MSHNLTPSNTFADNVTVPDNDEPREAGPIATAMQATFNKVYWCWRRLTGATAIADNLTFTGNNELDGTTDFYDDVTQQTGTLKIANGAFFNLQSGAIGSIAGLMSFTGAGRRKRSYVVSANADHTYAVGDGELIYLPDTLTADWIYTLSETGAGNGDQFQFVVDPDLDTSITVTVKRADTTDIVTLGTDSAGPTVMRGATIVRAGGKWSLQETAKA